MTPDASPSPASAAPWRHILADTPDALIFADTQGVIRAWNAGAETVFGYGAVEALGQSLDLIIPERLRAAHWLGFNRAMARGTTSHGAEVRTTRGAHKDGRTLYVDMSFGVVRDDSGTVLGSVAMARDVTTRHLLAKASTAAPPGGDHQKS
ncbi:PAS domain S-box protein [Ottowia sp.]|uniref:PAS domain-containing protein n=1 Tax=Ottowia sp. TaxID=1898956 RepID=UPI002BDEAC25|nr:PAS domain S-box protein [Ottowia sp.]HOB67514.1 PAS domain S-box protein [Ottowia sp.]HPZ58741.1 PAS domain S-box protein [Ottowia sp.]HQD49038.1 PAS domain S-box protein [Ottowia sp.]